MKTLNLRKLDSFIKNALHEDVGDGDHTSLACIPEHQRSTGVLRVKDDGVIAGIEIAKRIFTYLDPESMMEVRIEDGNTIRKGDIAFTLECNSRALLKGERLALNTMQRLSGIATLSRAFQEETEQFDVTILDTRKTTPPLRFLEKWAVNIGGCSNYRDGLFDRIMIKDNHIEAAGSITDAVQRVLKYLKENNKELEMTVEVRNFVELEEVLSLPVKPRVMLDNFTVEELKEAIKRIDGRLETEASGGIKLNNVRKVASTGIDFISVGALTHSAQSLDLSLKIVHMLPRKGHNQKNE